MKHFKKLNTKGFAHWVAPLFVVVAIGGIGTYLVVGSHADTGDASTICGSGYKKIAATQTLADDGHGGFTAKPALVELYANANTKKICGFTYSIGDSYGKAKHMDVTLEATSAGGTFDKSRKSQHGSFKYVAGPIKLDLSNYKPDANDRIARIYASGGMTFNGTKSGVAMTYYVTKNFVFQEAPPLPHG
jgi:hypothetical protein